MTFDAVIVGGGIVGLATARALVAGGRWRVAVLEGEAEIARHQSGRNSGVLHSGLYYRPGSLKARNCVEGSRELYRYCEERGIPHERCGKLVVAAAPDEVPALEELARRGRANGLAGLRRLAAEEIGELEPHAAGVAALWVPDTGIVDFGAVAAAFAADVRGGGGEVLTSHRVVGVRREAAGQVVVCEGDEVRGSHLVNCAGLQSDRLARLCGVDPGLRIVPFRGDYFELAEDRRSLVRNLIYPVPDPELPFLGVHLTRAIDGRVLAGPNAVLALARERYGRFAIAPRDAFDALGYPGVWRLLGTYRRLARSELVRSLSRRAFAAAVRRLLPEISSRDLRRAGSGIRAQAVLPSGRLADDFRVVEAERSTHVLNAPSPAATASLAIGRDIARRVEARLAE